MDGWSIVFREARNLAQSAGPWSESLRRAIEFARGNPGLFDDRSFWNRVESHDWRDAFTSVVSWSREGWENLAKSAYWSQTWEFIKLDLGDCPEIFNLNIPGGQVLMAEEKIRDLLLRDGPLGCSELTTCFSPGIAAPFNRLFGDESTTWVYHNVRELDDQLLSWNDESGAQDYFGNNGYFLWLVLGSLAMLTLLFDPALRQGILRERARLYLLSGFEEIFTYLATVRPEGLQYERLSLPTTGPETPP